jgi:hypothetical protein
MPALQCFVSGLERGDETCADISTDKKCFFYVLER